MEALLITALSGFGLSAGFIVSIGPQSAHVLRQGLGQGPVFAVASTCFLCDALLIPLGAFGFYELAAAIPALTTPISWGGVVFLVWYGARALRSALQPAAFGLVGHGTRHGAVLRALALSLLNPHVYLDTVVLLGSVAGQYAGPERAAFVLGALGTSLLWFYGLGYGAAQLAPLFARPVTSRILDAVVAASMWLTAGGLLYGAIGLSLTPTGSG